MNRPTTPDVSMTSRNAGICALAAIVMIVLSFSGSGAIAPVGVVAGVVFALVMSGLCYVALRANLPITGTLVLTVGLAFANGLGSAASGGATIPKLPTRTDATAVHEALILVVVFQAVLVAACVAGARQLKRPPQTGEHQSDSIIWIFLAATLLAAMSSGTWTYYGADRADVSLGAFQLNYLYMPTLLGVFAHMLHRRGRLAGLINTVLFFLIFVTQMRRFMVTAAILAMITMLRRPEVPWKKMVAGGLTALILLSVGSAAWRRSSEDFNTNSLPSRVADAVTRLGDLDGVTEQLRERASVFLWLNAVAVENAPKLEGAISLQGLFATTLWLAVPGALAPDKYDREQESCETSLAIVGLGGVDLPCTPEAEAYLAAGFSGVIVLALLWAAMFLLIEYLWSRSPLMTLVAAHLFFFCSLVETSAFPQIHGARSAAMTLMLVGPVVVLLKALRGLPVASRTQGSPVRIHTGRVVRNPE